MPTFAAPAWTRFSTCRTTWGSPASLAPKINAVLFVVRADYTSARNAREALQQLRQRQATTRVYDKPC
jgi:hypothetical protein